MGVHLGLPGAVGGKALCEQLELASTRRWPGSAADAELTVYVAGVLFDGMQRDYKLDGQSLGLSSRGKQGEHFLLAGVSGSTSGGRGAELPGMPKGGWVCACRAVVALG